MNDINIYGDSSGHSKYDKLPYMILSYVAVPVSNVKKLKSDIKMIVQRHGGGGELKWQNVFDKSLPLYNELVNFYQSSGIVAKCIVVNKSQVLIDEDVVFNKIYFDNYCKLFRHYLDMDADCRYKIYLNKKDTRSSSRLTQMRSKLGNDKIVSAQFIESSESVFVQLVDVLIGALNYKLRFESKRRLPSKNEVVNLIFPNQDIDVEFSDEGIFFLEI